MAAAKLVTRCPACRTAFRLVADQLRLRQGLVRCGHCETVFDAREHLIEVPAPAASASSRPPQQAPEPVAAAPAATAPTASSTHFDPGYDPGYDVPALDSPTMMMAPAEDEEAPAEVETPGGQDAGSPSIEPAAEDSAQPATQEAEASEAEPSEAEPADSGPVEAANGKTHAGQEADQAYAAIGAAHAPWPALDSSALDDEESSTRTTGAAAPKASEDQVDAPVDAPVNAPVTEEAAESGEPVLRSASEFLRAQSSDSTETPGSAPHTPAEAATPKAPHEPDNDYGRNYGPTYGPSTSDAFSATAGAIAREDVERRWARQEPQLGPAFAPDFLRQARERERERAREAAATPAPPRLRYGWHIAAGVLAIGVLLQGLYLMRGQLAGQFPALRPMLEAACRPLGCVVPPWRDIDALRIDTSQLQKQDEGSDAYILAVTLRNQGRATTALPAIELVMTDLQDQLLLRRVLEPSEYLEPAQKPFATHGLRAGTELQVRVRFRTQQAAANYRVLIFYP
ncbi:DUF3426 domain-containing protein [Cupriavidus sp. WKF15]|uniref:DUF3426 domain-containing protein n=1 Tax=Cupriavidus sp. WKF15 TaxID=3032282 RepID=UPI0023E0EC93|nr:DUF3426 domain-containing protein [Cupriavidus sp. WKF15]WER45446.1 DUF3426 domain-containing protein [Cupriavidus sp. WKF15]